jgi:hypothetical protein
MDLCKYKYLFGVPGQGVHQYRIFNIGIIDILTTILGAYILSYLFSFSFLKTLLVLFIVGEFIHYIFCVDTAVMVFLFPNKFHTPIPPF